MGGSWPLLHCPGCSLGHSAAAAAWYVGVPYATLSCRLQASSSSSSSSSGSLRWGQPPPGVQQWLCPGAGGQLAPKISTEWIRDHSWVHQAPRLAEEDAFPPHRPRPEGDRAVLGRHTLFAGSSIPHKAWHDTCTWCPPRPLPHHIRAFHPFFKVGMHTEGGFLPEGRAVIALFLHLLWFHFHSSEYSSSKTYSISQDFPLFLWSCIYETYLKLSVIYQEHLWYICAFHLPHLHLLNVISFVRLY